MMDTTPREAAEETLLQSYKLLLECGPQACLSKRELDAFEVGVYLAHAVTVAQVSDS